MEKPIPVTDELWVRKSGAATGSKILELAKNAHNLFIRQDPREQARLLKTLVSNSTFDGGSLSVAYVKPFDLLVEGNETENWLGGRETPETFRVLWPSVARIG